VRTATAQAFTAAHPLEGLATATGPTEVWNLLVDVQGEGTPAPRYATLANWVLDQRPGNEAAFEQSRAELFALLKQHAEGFVVSRLLRLLGTPGRYQAIHVRTTDAGVPAVPAVQAYAEAHPIASYTSTRVGIEVYGVVQTALPT
jgi:hypothetical protein